MPAATAARRRAGVIDPRDTPTAEYVRHHSVITRARNSAGKRILSRLEQWLRNGDITPEQADAGIRFAGDWTRAYALSGGSVLAAMPGRNAGSMTPEDRRLDAARRYQAAREALDGSASPLAVGTAPSEVVRWLVVNDDHTTEMAWRLRVDHRKVKRRLVKHLGVLAQHYDAADRLHGRNRTPSTTELALRMFEPDDPADE